MMGVCLSSSLPRDALETLLEEDDSKELAEREQGLLLDVFTFVGEGVRPDATCANGVQSWHR